MQEQDKNKQQLKVTIGAIVKLELYDAVKRIADREERSISFIVKQALENNDAIKSELDNAPAYQEQEEAIAA